jgi:hypothetical protein
MRTFENPIKEEEDNEQNDLFEPPFQGFGKSLRLLSGENHQPVPVDAADQVGTDPYQRDHLQNEQHAKHTLLSVQRSSLGFGYERHLRQVGYLLAREHAPSRSHLSLMKHVTG